MPIDPLTDEWFPANEWDELLDGKGAESMAPGPTTHYRPTPTFSSYKDAQNRFGALSNQVAGMLPGYYNELGSHITTNRLGGLTFDLFKLPHTRGVSGPGSLDIEAHGYPGGAVSGNEWYSPGGTERDSFRRVLDELVMHKEYILDSRKLGYKDKQRLIQQADELIQSLPGTSPYRIPVTDLVKALGPRTNQIRQLINTACYGAGVTPQEWKQMFPALTNVVQSATDLPTTFGSSMRLSEVSDYTNAPDTSPLYNYPLDVMGNPVSTNVIMGPADWSPIK